MSVYAFRNSISCYGPVLHGQGLFVPLIKKMGEKRQ